MTTTTILVVEDDNDLREALCDTLKLAGYSVVHAGNGVEALPLLTEKSFDLVVSDIQMPAMDGHNLLKKIKAKNLDVPVILMTAYGTIQQAVDAMRDGAVDYMVKPFEAEVLVNMVSRYARATDVDTSELIAVDPVSRELVQMAKRVAQSDATVLITGESGSGKEVLARFVHQQSMRANSPFVAINCAAIPENMLEATLFGYEKGAYTGAYKSSPGKFEQAQGGTLLLDEITEMDLGLQAKLLRVIQEREVERLGGGKTIALDVRIIATSNRDVHAYIAEGRFREDLFYRLNVFPLHISALRDRAADIVPLAQRLLELHCQSQKRAIAFINAAAQQRLIAHDWPGNVRELDNVIQRTLILQGGEQIGVQDIHFESARTVPAATRTVVREVTASPVAPDATGNDSLGDELRHKEWHVIVNTIKAVNGSRKRAAERLGISQRTLRYKLARMRDEGIAIPDKLFSESL